MGCQWREEKPLRIDLPSLLIDKERLQHKKIQIKRIPYSHVFTIVAIPSDP